jgi:hypothetical protein
MKLLARLLSHSFAIVVVVLLAIGFVYRGELFPEWELPDFLVLDSAESTASDMPAGKIEPAPIQDDRIASGAATGDQQASDAEDAAVADATPPVEEVAEYSAPVMTESAPADVSEGVVAVEAEMPVAPAVEVDMPATEVPAPAEAVEEPVVLDVQEPVEEVATSAPEATAEVPAPAEAVEEPVVLEVQEYVEEVTTSASEATAEVPAPAVADEEPVVLEVQEYVEEVTTSASEATADSGTTASPATVTAADSAAETATAVVADEPAAPVAGDMTDSTPPAPEVVTAPDVAVGDASPAAESAAPMPEPVAAGEVAAQGSASQVETDEAISYYQLLASAREAYWLRDYQAAEDFYQRMIVADPDNPDGYGELANMYFSQGSWEAAASAYYEAGLRLVKSGLLAHARDLVEVIRGLNGPQADALDQEIQAARGSSQ